MSRTHSYRIRRAGPVLRPPELGAPTRGHLSVLVDDGKHSSLKPALVEHIGASGTPRAIMPPIFDVVLVRLEGDSFTLRGIEIESFKAPS